MDLSKLKPKLEKDIESIGYHLYSLNYYKKDNILEVLIDESLDLDEISKLSEKISSFMDKYDEEFDNYMLDVASAGIERTINIPNDVTKAIGSYVHIKTVNDELNGNLIKFDNDELFIEYLDKTRKKELKVNAKDVKELRYAVKF